VPVKDAELVKAIDRLGDHYQRNISNRFIKQALSHLSIPQATWERIDRLTTKSGYAEANGYEFEELYEMILAAATLVSQARKHVVPSARTFGGRSGGRATAGDRGEGVLREMAFQTFPSNLMLFADLVNELYLKTVELDKRDHAGKKGVFERMPELRDLGKLLIASE
jgi:hypothetical protein